MVLEGGALGRAAVPSGASTGEREAVELRDGNKKRYLGRGVQKAVAAVNDVIAGEVIGEDALDQALIDALMIDLDGTETKKRLGANAILAVSLAVAKAAAEATGQPLYRYVGGVDARTLPVPCMNIINGGAHADNKLDPQEFMVAPHGFDRFAEALRAGVEIFHNLKAILKKKGHSTAVGDEGGFAPRPASPAKRPSRPSSRRSGPRATSRARRSSIALDPAASEFHDGKKYVFKKSGGATKTSDQMIAMYERWVKDYPIVSIEDGLGEKDWEGWRDLTKALGSKIQLVGDDLFVTNPKILAEGIEKGIGNSILDQGEPDRHPHRDPRLHGPRRPRRLHLHGEPPERRDRGHDHRRPRRRHGVRPDQDGLGLAHRPHREVQPAAAHRGRAGADGALRGASRLQPAGIACRRPAGLRLADGSPVLVATLAYLAFAAARRRRARAWRSSAACACGSTRRSSCPSGWPSQRRPRGRLSPRVVPGSFPCSSCAGDLGLVWPGRPWLAARARPELRGAVAPFLAIVAVLAVTQYPLNRRTATGEFLLDDLERIDTAFHVGRHLGAGPGYPPQVPGLSGVPLGYHVGPHLIRAAALRWAGTHPYDALYRFDVDPLGARPGPGAARRRLAPLGAPPLAVALASRGRSSRPTSRSCSASFGRASTGGPSSCGETCSSPWSSPTPSCRPWPWPSAWSWRCRASRDGRRARLDGRRRGPRRWPFPSSRSSWRPSSSPGLGVAIRGRRRRAAADLGGRCCAPALLATAGPGRWGREGATVQVLLDPLASVALSREMAAASRRLVGPAARRVGDPLARRLASGCAFSAFPRPCAPSRSRDAPGAILAVMALVGLAPGPARAGHRRRQSSTNRSTSRSRAAPCSGSSPPSPWRASTAIRLAAAARPRRSRRPSAPAFDAGVRLAQGGDAPRRRSGARHAGHGRRWSRRAAPGDVVLMRPFSRYPPPPIVFVGRRVPFTQYMPYMRQFAPAAELRERGAGRCGTSSGRRIRPRPARSHGRLGRPLRLSLRLPDHRAARSRPTAGAGLRGRGRPGSTGSAERLRRRGAYSSASSTLIFSERRNFLSRGVILSGDRLALLDPEVEGRDLGGLAAARSC